MGAWEIVGAVGGVLLGVPAFLLAARKVVGEVRLLSNHSALLTRLESDKSEVMAHITANRIMAAEHTDSTVNRLRSEHATVLDRHSQTLDAVFGLLVELDAKVVSRGKRPPRRVETVGAVP